MTAKNLRDRIAEMNSHVLFDYKGKTCGVDPLTKDLFNIWFGNELISAYSIEEVMGLEFFDGKSLNDIAEKIEIYE